MADILSLVSSIIQVAAFGLKLSRTLHDYGDAVVGAEKRLEGLENDISFISNIISQLGSHLKDSQVQALVPEDTIRLAQQGVAECHAIFQAMEDVIEKIRKGGSLAKWTIYFRDSKIELLRSNLDRMKGNLNLLLNIVNHGTQITTKRLGDEDLAAHRAGIRELLAQKEYYTQRYLDEKRKYDELLERINSSSTLGSLLLITSTDESLALLRQVPLEENGSNDDRIPEAESSRDAARRRWSVASLQGGESMPAHGAPDQQLTPPKAAARAATPTSITSRARSESASSAQPESTQPQPTTRDSGIELRVLVAPPPPSEPSRATPPLRRKRDKAVEIAKHAAKCAGIVLAAALGVALFPVTIPLYFVIRRRRQRQRRGGRSHTPPSSMLSHTPPRRIAELGLGMDGYPAAVDPRQQQLQAPAYSVAPPWPRHSPQAGTAQAPLPQSRWHPGQAPEYHYPYDSWRIPGELPSMVELAAGSAAPVEMAVTERLLGELVELR